MDLNEAIATRFAVGDILKTVYVGVMASRRMADGEREAANYLKTGMSIATVSYMAATIPRGMFDKDKFKELQDEVQRYLSRQSLDTDDTTEWQTRGGNITLSLGHIAGLVVAIMGDSYPIKLDDVEMQGFKLLSALLSIANGGPDIDFGILNGLLMYGADLIDGKTLGKVAEIELAKDKAEGVV